jgi:hypothetical protein
MHTMKGLVGTREGSEVMDKNEWLKKPMGIPVDPRKQKDPEEHGDRVPAEGRASELNDVTGQDGGQRSEVGMPYDDDSVERGIYEEHGGRGEPRKIER